MCVCLSLCLCLLCALTLTPYSLTHSLPSTTTTGATNDWETSLNKDYGAEVWVFEDAKKAAGRDNSNSKLHYSSSLDLAHSDDISTPFLKSFMAERKQESIDILKIDVKSLGDFVKEIISWLDQQWLPFREIFINFNQLRDCNAKWDDETCKDTKYLHQRILASLKVNHYEKVYDHHQSLKHRYKMHSNFLELL